MDSILHEFKDVSLLITHYNRGKSLERLLKSFKDLNCVFGDIVVSDDCSQKKHLDYVKDLQNTYNFRLITTPKNGGLGNNINKGQDAVTTPYTLYIQEDFTPKTTFPEHFTDAYHIMQEDDKWDLICLYSYTRYPYLKPFKHGFSEKILHLSPLYTKNLKFFYYSDHPHLRKTSFPEKFGRYKEGINVDKTEMQMSLAFMKNRGNCLFYDDHYGLLTQENSSDEPSTATFRRTLEDNGSIPVKVAKWLYAKFKFIKLNYLLLVR
ncbi:glycosyltransferase [Pedobacter antarcticus]|uniref:glycosyltransferase n=1 Tax=Pedobacter antarcticus TaxID=34086 RepID=UPI00292EE0EC|nr:glycosyltransferase [Pedobacter antarcticus]